jgi:hypothetical protein
MASTPPSRKEGAGTVRVPSGQAEADPAAGRPVHPARRLRTGSDAVAPDVSAVAAGFPEDQGLRRLPHRALARRRSVQRAAQESINRIIIQFLNRARGLWYTKPLINRVS